MPAATFVDQGASFDAARTYRYRLWRVWRRDLPRVAFVMLNPSTADETLLDATVRRCVGFARAWRCGGVEVGNAFALRTTDPRALYTHADPIGPDNDAALLAIARRATFGVVAGWGVHGAALAGADGPSRATEVEALLGRVAELLCLGTTKDGAPRHPLYLAATARPTIWRRRVRR